jgi:hypothetical protein
VFSPVDMNLIVSHRRRREQHVPEVAAVLAAIPQCASRSVTLTSDVVTARHQRDDHHRGAKGRPASTFDAARPKLAERAGLVGPRARALAVQRRSRGTTARRQMQNNFSPHQ